MFFLNSLYGLLEKITEYALNELYNEKEIKRKIMELAVLFELNEIDEAEYDRIEKILLAQLREARAYNDRMRKMEASEDEYEEDEVQEYEDDEDIEDEDDIDKQDEEDKEKTEE